MYWFVLRSVQNYADVIYVGDREPYPRVFSGIKSLRLFKEHE